MVCRVVATSPGHPCPFTNYPWIIKIDEKKRGDGKGRRRRVERVSKCSLVCFSLMNLSPMSRGHSKLIGLDEVRGGKHGTQSSSIFWPVWKSGPKGCNFVPLCPVGGNDNFPRTLDRPAQSASRTQCQGVELRLCGIWTKSHSPLTMGWNGWQELRLKANSGAGPGGTHLQPENMEEWSSPITSLRKTYVT